MLKIIKPKNKISAFGIHFIFSALIFILFIITLRIFWYPEPYFTASGGWQGLKLVAFIDVILGPLLTFVVFNPQKSISELTKDLSIVFILQLTVLIWGIFTVYNQRPIAIVFWGNNFYTVSYKEIYQTHEDSPLLTTLTENKLLYYFVPKPTIIKGIKDLNIEVLAKKATPYQLIERYEPASNNFNHIKSRSIDIHEIITSNESMKKALMKILSDSKTKIDNNVYIPLISRYQNIILVFNNTGTLLGSIKAPFKQ